MDGAAGFATPPPRAVAVFDEPRLLVVPESSSYRATSTRGRKHEGERIVKRTCTRARERFLEAEKFNQPLDKWSDRLGEVTHMEAMFYEATDFNQDLGWCLATGVSVGSMFLDTKCGSLSGCGVTQSGSCPP